MHGILTPVRYGLDFMVFALRGRGRKCTQALLNHIILIEYLAICPHHTIYVLAIYQDNALDSMTQGF